MSRLCPLGVSLVNAIKTMEAHPEAKAILLVYPNYYGIGVDIVNIVKEAHKRGLIVLVDEAHGPHLPFSESLPIEATEAGADLVAQSTHKSVGSLTQTSWLLGQGKKIDKRRITQMHQMLQSTSPNYIFLASLDMARHQLATAGNDLVSRAVELSMYLREELNKISGIAAMEYTDIQERVINYDCTKVLIDAKELGLTGVEFERMLREHHIEVELVQAHHVLVLITIGDTKESVTALIKAVQAVSEKVLRAFKEFNKTEEEQLQDISKDSALLPAPIVRITPRNAMYANREQVPLKEALHRIAAFNASISVSSCPFMPTETQAAGSTWIPVFFPSSSTYLTVSSLSTGGFVLAMVTTVVKPPFFAAAVPVPISSL